MRLYDIAPKDILDTLEQPDQTVEQWPYRIVLKRFFNKWDGKPLKVIYNPGDRIIVTAYPLKKAQKGFSDETNL